MDRHMQSFNESEGAVQYKSALEYRAIRYADFNPGVRRFSLEPFSISYVKPTTGKVHRYYVDLYLEFTTDDKFLVEVKSKAETQEPKAPKKKTDAALLRYQRAMITWAINQAKWKAATAFAKSNGMRFIILTEDQLK